MTGKFTPAAQNALSQAQKEASELGHTYIGTEHLLLGLISVGSSVASELLSRRGLSYEKVKETVIGFCGSGEKTVPPPSEMTPHLKKVIENAALASPGAFGRIGTEQLLIALISEENCFASRIIEKQRLSPSALLSELSLFEGRASARERKKKLPPSLIKYGCNLNVKASDPVIGRERETAALIEVLSRRRKNNPCLVGEPGVGKTAVVEGLAARIEKGDVPSALVGKTVISLDIAAILSGAKYRGEFEERMKTVLLEASEDDSIILFIDELHTIVGTGASEGSIDAANLLKPALSRGEIRLIGATTVSEYRRHIESDPALERRFRPINVEEPSEEETRDILLGLKDKYEEFHGVKITDGAIDSAIALSGRYYPLKRLPDKALDLLDEALASKRIAEEERKREALGLRGILSGVSAFDGSEEEKLLIPIKEKLRLEIEEVKEDEKNEPVLIASDIENVLKRREGSLHLPSVSEISDLEKRLSERVFGQSETINAVVPILRSGLIGIKNAASPVASFLFVGPSGVGKTELASAVAEEFYGSKSALIRFDMSEYSESHSLSKLIGSPPGYVGYRDEGLLTKEISLKPYSVLLFDEAEKAHPDIFSLLLQILDSGFITDSQGKKADFRGCVVILTSNLGSEEKRGAGFSSPDKSTKTSEALKGFFRPELLGRLSATVPFSRLSEDSTNRIAESFVRTLSERLSENGLEAFFHPSAVRYVAKAGINSPYGARAISKRIKSELEPPLILRLSSPFECEKSEKCEIFEENGKIVVRSVTKQKLSHIM